MGGKLSLIEQPAAPRELAWLNQAKRALAEARSLPDICAIRNTAEAVRRVLEVRGDAIESQNYATEVVLRAERKAGSLLREMPKNRGVVLGGCTTQPPGDEPTYADLNIEKTAAHRWQRLSQLEDGQFESYVGDLAAAGERLTAAGALRYAQQETKRERREAIAAPRGETCTVEDLVALAASGRRYATVYADPPWAYGNQGTRASTGNHYVTMSVAEIAALPVEPLLEPNAHLHLWTTNAFLFEAKAIIEAWGFEYKSCFIWVKPQIGMGNYWRLAHEFLLLGVRGDAAFRSRSQISWGEFPRRKHSAKPEAIRKLVELVSAGDYLELFGRRSVPGWTVWGNEIDHDELFPNARGAEKVA